MELTLKSINVVFLFLFLIWILKDWRKRHCEKEKNRCMKSTTFQRIILLLNLIIAAFYLGSFLYEFWVGKSLNIDSLLAFMAWVLASGFVICFLKKVSEEQKRWPFMLILWWVFSCILNSLLVFVYLLKKLESIHIPKFLSTIDFAEFTSCPLSILLLCLCFIRENSPMNHKESEQEQPFLHKDKLFGEEEEDGYSKAGIWSRITFMWLNPLFKKGNLVKIESQDVPSIPKAETAAEAFSLLEEYLLRNKFSKTSFSKAILLSFQRPLAFNAAFAGANTLASYTGPLLITTFVDFLATKRQDTNWRKGMILAFAFLFAKMLESLSQRQWYFGAQRIGIRIKAALMVLIYKKSLTANYTSLSGGKIINVINVDVERIGDSCLNIHGIWLLPLQVILALMILYRNLGAAPALAAFLSTLFVMMSNTPLANMQQRFHNMVMESKDSRIKATSETVKNIKVVKLHSWESIFMKKLMNLREIERSWIKKYLYTSSVVVFLFWTSPTLVSVATFGMCIVLKTPLTSGTVLSALATFRILQEPIYNFPELVSMIAQAKISLDRVEKFVNSDDQNKLKSCQNPNVSDFAVEIETGEYSWDNTSPSKQSKPTITISEKISIMKGQKVAICGSVGSGKSSFLCTILGEIPRISGASIKAFGSKAFVPQSAWIQTGTIRDNVLFGHAMNLGFYNEVLKGCALNHDIDMLMDKDLSTVGERGMNLSGGQKQRIQMARAIYSNSDVYLFDDPFSAVDVHTGTHMFKECLFNLLGSKTVIYVTHQLEFLEAADLVLVMKDGKIVQSGKYEDLIADSKGEFITQKDAHTKSLNQVNSSHQHNQLIPYSNQNNGIEPAEESVQGFNIICPTQSEKFMKEERESGPVKWRTYSTFITSAYRGFLVLPVLLCHVLFQGLQIASNYWIAWGTEEEERVSSKKLIAIFVLLSAGSSLFILGRAVLLSTIAIETAQRLFLNMTNSIFRAPLSFFDSTPSSRILSRSSTDQSIVDTDVPYRVAGLAFALIQLLSIVVLMSHAAWQMWFLFLVILIISIWYQAYYRKTARELARLIGIQKAPILHHLSETIAGAAPIRCFNQETRFFEKNMDLVDDYSCVAFHNSAAMEWLCVRINFLFNVAFFFLLVILLNIPRSAIDPSLAGLAATYGLSLNVLQAWVIWNVCNVENKMISVERILQFTNLPTEAPSIIKTCRPGHEWPVQGTILIENLHLRYGPNLPSVLKGITCTFPAKRKIGIVGRTGSGKSTLIQALFRVVEPSEGRILIDGLDISKIGLQDLRSKLSIIPQDPILFPGTVRSNLDILQKHSDQEIWEVLNKCHLAKIIKEDQRLLDAPVAEDGENWSIGQRQLLCLARALLEKRRILVLDEATASVDTVTDSLIQKTIKEDTTNCTVLMVAHRIPTVIDTDLVLVVGEGRVVEYDCPTELLRNKSSAFSSLVSEYLTRSSIQ